MNSTIQKFGASKLSVMISEGLTTKNGLMVSENVTFTFTFKKKLKQLF